MPKTEEIRAGRWYPIVKYPIDRAAECVAICAWCDEEHQVTWATVKFGTREFLAFIKGPWDGGRTEGRLFVAKCEIKRFKVRRFLPEIVIDPRLPLLEPTMYMVPQEIAMLEAGDDDYNRVIN